MSAEIIRGRPVADRILEQTREDVAALRERGHGVRLVSIEVGENPAVAVYTRNQRRSCERVGIDFQSEWLPESITEEELIEVLRGHNEDGAVTGIIIQRPLPEHINELRIQAKIHPDKDVEGMNPANLGMMLYGRPNLVPCTALAAVELLVSTDLDIAGRDAVVVGHSSIVGKPVAFLLLDRFATTTVCHIATKDLRAKTRASDILIVAVGRPKLISADMIKPGAAVIDIGINRVPAESEDGRPLYGDDGRPKMKIVGDVDFDAACEVAGYITPVPGGVGPVTVAMLMRNTLVAAIQQSSSADINVQT
ncbi:MAG: bifunctional 5,10-methylenetetrahydrofolate dehydrogenase/5,10-methenyltetrahydrofolate cyclohydrolase [Planctomycetota bacterium]